LLGGKRHADSAIIAIENLKRDIGIPQRLRDLRNPPRFEQLRDFAEKASVIKRILRVNPRSVTAQECEAIYREAW
jgi:alcohol dehydrogenase class IV